jgi:hypothetical protein
MCEGQEVPWVSSICRTRYVATMHLGPRKELLSTRARPNAMAKSQMVVLLAFLTMGGLAACQDASVETELVISESGACGDSFFWGLAGDSNTAVTVDTDLRDRSPSQATTVTFSVPSKKVKVEILDVEDPNFCDDLGPPPPSQAVGRDPVTGSGVITVGPALDPVKACGQVEGDLTLTGLRAEDGTTFAPIHITSNDIGCYAG